jgi:hypothetical protein
LEKQRAGAENATLSTPELGAFCLCYGRALADVINGAEYEALAAGKLSDGFAEKQRLYFADEYLSTAVTREPIEGSGRK